MHAQIYPLLLKQDNNNGTFSKADYHMQEEPVEFLQRNAISHNAHFKTGQLGIHNSDIYDYIDYIGPSFAGSTTEN